MSKEYSMHNDNIHDIIAKYLNQEASDTEIDRIRIWCSQSEENAKEFVQLKKAWILSNKNIDEEINSAKSKIWLNIANHFVDVKPLQQYSKRTLIYYSSISAAVAILIMCCISFFIMDYPSGTEQYTYMYMPKGEKGQLFLPDGTKVWLNSDTKVTMSNGFNTENRKIYLEGEAYFDVSKNDKHKFTVDVGGLDVVVYGTTFKVTALPKSPDVRVALHEGKVSILNSRTNQILAALLPDEEVVIQRNSYSVKKQKFDSDYYISWTFDELIFEYASVEEVFSQMENWYGVDIKVQSKKPDLKYRFRIKTETLTEILQLMDKMTPIQYKINGKEVIVNYK